MPRPRTPEIAADIVIELEDRPGRPIVVIRRAYPPLGHALPGGFVDIGETVEHAAVREVLAEMDRIRQQPVDPRNRLTSLPSSKAWTSSNMAQTCWPSGEPPLLRRSMKKPS